MVNTVLAELDELAGSADGERLAAWVRTGRGLASTPVCCPETTADAAARVRLDLALRMLHGAPAAQWCRPAGDGTAVVRTWPLPATAIAVHGPGDDEPRSFVLAVGRAGGRADVWRFELARTDTSDITARARELLPG